MKICIAGATGLTGSFVFQHAIKMSGVHHIILPLRKPLEHKHENITQVITDFSDEALLTKMLTDIDAIICCIGTTIKKAGSQEAFRKVDFEIPLKMARCASSLTKTFVLMSSVGADKTSNNFYLKTKGETEEAVFEHFKGRLIIARPSLLLGNRKELRAGEKAAIYLSPLFNLFMQGALKKYKAIKAETVARAMLQAAIHPNDAPQIMQYNELILASKALA